MEVVRFPSRGGFSVRSIFTFVLAVLVTVLLWAILSSTPIHAADATWEGASIKHDGKQYIQAGEAKQGDGLNIPVGAKYYAATEPAQGQSANSPLQKAFIIYFAPGNDPPTATSATYVTYDYNSSTKVFSKPSGAKSISIDQSSGTSGTSSCVIEGVGWIVCPIMTFLSTGMDWVFSALSSFMEVQPVQTGNTQNSLFAAWNVMRGIANVAFIIVFIIIIYSQLTNVQISNYGLKRLLPRLIIAAIAVNISYIICAIAVDISNILGYSLQDIFINIRNQMLSTPGSDNTSSLLSWESITGFVISGGTAVAALGIGTAATLVATGGVVAAAVYLLLPALVGLLVVILVVLLILAARQALVTILIIVAPIAIVAYLLPNTEKWFGKWRDLFMTMLIFFPAFSVVFGGSQLAGAIIIQNANSINMLILGMIVQVAPLVITPLLLKFSGSLLGSIARLVNNPNKGIIDRTRKWSGERAEMHRQRGISGADRKFNPGELKGRNVLRRTARSLDQRKRVIGDRTKNATLGSDNAYHDGKLYDKRNLANQTAAFESDKGRIHDEHAAHVEHARVTPGSLLYGRTLRAEEAKHTLEAAQNTTNTHLNTQRTLGGSALNSAFLNAEATKSGLDTSDNLKNIYLNNERATPGTQLNATVQSLEASKLNLDASNSRYTAMVEDMKVNSRGGVNSPVADAARNAQSNKELLEAAQLRVQATFDRERATAGSVLNVSTVELEGVKVNAEGAKAQFTQYITDLKSETGTSFHEEVIRTEKLKQGQQVSEARFTRIIEEYKAGGKVREEDGVILIDGKPLMPQERALMAEMVQNVEQLSAEKQGAQSATGVQQQNINSVLADNDSARGAELLDVAGSVDPNGRQRALANALAQQFRARKDTLENIRAIINYRNLNTEEIRQLAEGEAEVNGIRNTQDVTATAIQMTLGGKDTKQIMAAFQNIDFSFPHLEDGERKELQILAANALAENAARPPFMTAGFIAMMKEGKAFNQQPFAGPLGEEGVNAMVATAVNSQKVDSEKLAVAGRDYSNALLNSLADADNPTPLTDEGKDRLLGELAKTFKNKSGGLGDSKKPLLDARDRLAAEAINTGVITARKLKIEGLAYAEAILETLRRSPDAIDATAREALYNDVAHQYNTDPELREEMRAAVYGIMEEVHPERPINTDL